MAPRPSTTRRDVLSLAMFYTDQSDDTPAEEGAADEALVIPGDLTALSIEEIDALAVQAEDAFAALYDGGAGATVENMGTEDEPGPLRSLTQGIEALAARRAELAAAQALLAEEAAALAVRVNPAFAEGDPEDETAEDEGEDAPAEGDAPAEDETPADEPAEAVVAAAAPRPDVRVNLSALGARTRQTMQAAQATTVDEGSFGSVVTASSDLRLNGIPSGWDDVARGLDRKFNSFPEQAYDSARRTGKRLHDQFGLATIQKTFDPDMRITEDSSQSQIEAVMKRAMDETRLPGGSLVASGGWCAPSETVYDMCELESRDGMISLPEIGIARGGLRFTQGPDFATIYNATGFSYTEQEDIDGDYDGEGGGSKPCYHVECPEFDEERLNLDGVCITAGLLQRRGYPEAIARVIRGALVAHDHKLNANKIGALIAGSTAVAMNADPLGAAAPLLTAIELQVEHMRSLNRLARGRTIEAVFPFWVRGAIRSDLSRRLGIAEFDVSDQRINAWFAQRGINAQFVYDWQGVESTPASGFVAWPNEVEFLLYPSGTWVIGGADVITLDTVYDSVLLGTNDYTALFSEEGWLAAKMCHDSRAVTVPICANGLTAAGVEVDCDGADASA